MMNKKRILNTVGATLLSLYTLGSFPGCVTYISRQEENLKQPVVETSLENIVKEKPTYDQAKDIIGDYDAIFGIKKSFETGYYFSTMDDVTIKTLGALETGNYYLYSNDAPLNTFLKNMYRTKYSINRLGIGSVFSEIANPEIMQNIFEKIDTNNDYVCERNEVSVYQKKIIKQLFEIVDKNNNGYIDNKEIEYINELSNRSLNYLKNKPQIEKSYNNHEFNKEIYNNHEPDKRLK